jgi:organic radical activating enzyme
MRVNMQRQVVTGGEPLMWDMSLLTNKLKDVGRKVHIRNLLYMELGIGFVFLAKKQITNRDGVQCSHELKVIIHTSTTLFCRGTRN